MDYNSLSNHKEKADCAIRAVAVITATPYEDVHAIMTRLGRKPNSGTPWQIIVRSINKLGYAMVYVDTPCRTIRTLQRDLPKQGSYLISVREHVAGLHDGKVYDWTENRCNHIRSVWHIKRFRNLSKFDRKRLVNGTRSPSGKFYYTQYTATS